MEQSNEDPEWVDEESAGMKNAQLNRALSFNDTFRTTRNRKDIDEMLTVESNLFSPETDYLVRANLRITII